MYFSAFLGTDEGFPPWQHALSEHARWLGLIPQIESRCLDDFRNLSFGWLDNKSVKVNHRLKEVEEYIVASTLGGGSLQEHIASGTKLLENIFDDRNSNSIAIAVSLRVGEIIIAIPPTTPQQFYVARTSHGYVFADDMRLFPRLMETELDERAIYALFQYGAIPPTMTMYKGVHRVPNGHVFRLRPNSYDPVCTPFFQPTAPAPKNGATSARETSVRETLDRSLSDIPESAVLYFSGGVDSGLLASRLVKLGRTDIRLLNYCFGPRDEEAKLALQMATHLGLECLQVNHEMRRVSDVLQRLGKDYSFPFGDFSTVPTNILVHESADLARQSSMVIEGTGADGAFGIGIKHASWQRVYRVPAKIRRQIDLAYKGLGLWRHASKLERIGRITRKSLQMPVGPAVVAENALEGIAYTIPDNVRSDINQAIRANFEILSAGVGPEERISLLDLVWVCAGRMAPKSFDPLRTLGIQPKYPFLEFPMVHLSSSISWEEKCAAGEPKALLKRLLSQDVPKEWVYRTKSGFTPPHQEILASPVVQEFLRDVVLSKQNPLLDFCQIDKVERMIERSRQHDKLGPGACDFLWTLTFTSAWLHQSPGRMRQCNEQLTSVRAVAVTAA
jgi:asparagine synthase (glutamine-hydrolysing)